MWKNKFDGYQTSMLLYNIPGNLWQLVEKIPVVFVWEHVAGIGQLNNI